jgi:hypothetical protein
MSLARFSVSPSRADSGQRQYFTVLRGEAATSLMEPSSWTRQETSTVPPRMVAISVAVRMRAVASFSS